MSAFDPRRSLATMGTPERGAWRWLPAAEALATVPAAVIPHHLAAFDAPLEIIRRSCEAASWQFTAYNEPTRSELKCPTAGRPSPAWSYHQEQSSSRLLTQSVFHI